MRPKRYASDLTDAEWEILKEYIPQAKTGGRPRSADLREVLNAIFYVLKTGCQWSMLPREFPPKGTVYHYFNTWRQSGLWERLNAALRERSRQQAGRQASPSAALIDSQSVKTGEKGA